MAHYLFNLVKRDAADGPTVRELAAGFLDVGMWCVDEDEPHRDAVTAGDLVLIYLGSPERVFVGRAELASAVHDWTLSEAQVYPGDSPGEVLLARVEEWDPPAPMETVLSRIGPSENAKAAERASFGSPLMNMRPPWPWRPDCNHSHDPKARPARALVDVAHRHNWGQRSPTPPTATPSTDMVPTRGLGNGGNARICR